MYKCPLTTECNLYGCHEFHIYFWSPDWAFSKKTKHTNNKLAIAWLHALWVQAARSWREHQGMYFIATLRQGNCWNRLTARITCSDTGSAEMSLIWTHSANRSSQAEPGAKGVSLWPSATARCCTSCLWCKHLWFHMRIFLWIFYYDCLKDISSMYFS